MPGMILNGSPYPIHQVRLRLMMAELRLVMVWWRRGRHHKPAIGLDRSSIRVQMSVDEPRKVQSEKTALSQELASANTQNDNNHQCADVA